MRNKLSYVRYTLFAFLLHACLWQVSAREALYDAANDRIVLSGIYKADSMGALAQIAETLKNTNTGSDKLIHKATLKDKNGIAYEKVVFQYFPKEKVAVINADLVIKEALIIGTLDNSFIPSNYYQAESSGSPDETLAIEEGHKLVDEGLFCLYESKMIAHNPKEPFKIDNKGITKVCNAVLDGFSTPLIGTVSVVNSEIINFNTFVSEPWTSSGANLEVSGCMARNGKSFAFFYHSGTVAKKFSYNKLDNVNTSFHLLASDLSILETPYNNAIIKTADTRTSSLTVLQKLVLVNRNQATKKIKVKAIDKTGNVSFDREYDFTDSDKLELMVPIKKFNSPKTDKDLLETVTLTPYGIIVSFATKEQEYNMAFEKTERITVE
ncbi:MAG: hypothetical protein WCS96_03085 [Victivallales bacterium]